MASKKTLNAKNLQALGPRRLAELLIEIGEGDPAVKRRLRLELAGRESPVAVAREIRKRLASLARARSFVDWRKIRSLADDLQMHRQAIVDKVAKQDPSEGVDLMWRFMELANPTFDRCDDSNGVVSSVFHQAAADLGPIAEAASPNPQMLAGQAFDALLDNGYGQYDSLIPTLAPSLGQEGLDHLKQSLTALLNSTVTEPAEGEDSVTVAGVARQTRIRTIRHLLTQIADAQGDVDAFIAQYDEDMRKVPGFAVEIARRLLAADRAEEALQAIDGAGRRRRSPWDWHDFDWEDARIDVLDALGRSAEAQADRRSCFEQALSIPHLRAYLKRLPDFDDIEAEERALDYVESYTDPVAALSFLVSWPDIDRASALALRRKADLNGDNYWKLNEVADALAGSYPLAATIVLRSMIDFALANSQYKRYKYVAANFLVCSSMAFAIDDFGTFETHEAYAARLRREHGRKYSFWKQVS